MDAPDSASEREAERVAEQVLAAPMPASPVRQLTMDGIKATQESRHGWGRRSPPDIASRGVLLEPSLQHDMEQRFGQDFSEVRVHTGATAHASAQALHARAYTLGRDMVFAAGEFAPATPAGRRLIAHELTHVVQQSGDGAGPRISSVSGHRPQRQAVSRDDEATVAALIENAGSIDELRAIEDAIAAPEADVDNLIIVYDSEHYIVNAEAWERLLKQAAAQEATVLRISAPTLGLSLDERIDAAAAADDKLELADLQELIQSAVSWYEAEEKESGAPYAEWRVALRTGEQLKVEPAKVRAALAKVNKLAPSSIDAVTPKDVGLQNIQIGFRIAADRKLADGLWTGDSGASVLLTLSRSQLELSFSPGLQAKAMLMDVAKVNRVRLIFLTGAISVDASRDNTAFQETIVSETEETVRTALYALLQGSAFGKAGYNPFTDKWLSVRLEQFKQQMSQGGGKPDADQVGTADLSKFSLGGEIKLKAGFNQLDTNQTGLVVDSGAVIELTAESAGSLTGGNLATLKKLTLTATGVNLHSKGVAAVKLTQLSVKPGGTVSLEAFELLGGVKDAADIEQLGRVLGGMIGLASSGVPDQTALELAARSNPKAELVEGLTRTMVERQFTAAVQKLIRDNAQAIPGIDLPKAMGMQP